MIMTSLGSKKVRLFKVLLRALKCGGHVNGDVGDQGEGIADDRCNEHE